MSKTPKIPNASKKQNKWRELENAEVIRVGEKIGGGFIVLVRNRKTGRLTSPLHPFEHPALVGAVDEAIRLAAKSPRNTYAVLQVLATKSALVPGEQK